MKILSYIIAVAGVALSGLCASMAFTPTDEPGAYIFGAAVILFVTAIAAGIIQSEA